MIYPSLVRKEHCNIPSDIIINGNDIGDYGEAEILCEISLNCNFQGGGKQTYDKKGESISLYGTCYYPYDFCPNVSDISNGTVKIFGNERKIFKGEKARNLDGTVNYVRLELV